MACADDTCVTTDRLFAEDPVEFVRKVHSPLEDWLSPLVAATNLLQVTTVTLFASYDSLHSCGYPLF